jgi:hypothetical protein
MTDTISLEEKLLIAVQVEPTGLTIEELQQKYIKGYVRPEISREVWKLVHSGKLKVESRLVKPIATLLELTDCWEKVSKQINEIYKQTVENNVRLEEILTRSSKILNKENKDV